MLDLLALLSLLISILLGIAVATFWYGELGRMRADLRRDEIILGEAARMHRIGRQIAEVQEASESTVALGMRLARTMHRGIAAIPFEILEAIPMTRDTTRIVRASHDLIAGAVYDSIEAVNRGLGTQIRSQLSRSRSEPGASALPSVEGAGQTIGKAPPDKE